MSKIKDNLLEEQQKIDDTGYFDQLRDNVHDAVKDMYTKVTFDPKQHVYTRVSDGQWLAGCTEISGAAMAKQKGDILTAWAAKEATKYLGLDHDDPERIKEVLAALQDTNFTVKEFQELLKEAKGAYRRKSTEAKVDGTRGHEILEDYVKSKMGKGTFTMPEATDPLYRAIEQFIEWAEGNVSAWILSEARLCDVDNAYAGTMDAMALMKDNSLAIIDFKFAGQISDEYNVQLAGYQNCFEKYDIHPSKRIIVRLPKTLTRKVWNAKKYGYDEIPNDIEVKVVETPYDFDFKVFMAGREIVRYLNFVQKQEYKPTNKTTVRI